MSLVISRQFDGNKIPYAGHFIPPTPLNARVILQKKDHVGVSLNSISQPLYTGEGVGGWGAGERKRISEFNFNVFHVK